MVLIGLVSAASATVMAYWWITTRGNWWQWPAGRSLMALLAIITVITANAVLHSVFPVPAHVKAITYAALYLLMLSSMGSSAAPSAPKCCADAPGADARATQRRSTPMTEPTEAGTPPSPPRRPTRGRRSGAPRCRSARPPRWGCW